MKNLKTYEHFLISNFTEEDIENRSKLFQKKEFIEWLDKTAIDHLNMKDLEMYIYQYYEKFLKTNLKTLENVSNNELKDLSNRIYLFLDKYAGIRPDWDPKYDDDEDKYTSPDASQMKYCADMISKGLKPEQCWSEWSGGGYKPYSSKEGREEHDFLIKEIYKIINSK